MRKFGEIICKYRKIILIVAILLLIPSAIGMAKTKINYDILVYLPENVETIQGENILSDDFGMGAYSVLILDNMPMNEILKLEEDLKKIDNVALVASLADILGEGVPPDILPDDIKDLAYNENATIMMVTLKDSISSDNTMETIERIREMTDERCEISGMSAIILDTKNIFNSEFFIYVVISVILCLIILELALDSFVAPIFLLLNIGFAILYNMGSNILLGEISYITKAIASVLQLGVTTDFAIFLYHSYMSEKESGLNNEKAMANAITTTMGSVFGSSITTIAGFLALCGMNLTLGKDIGLVMAKGVLFGVICVVTVLPAMILCFNVAIEKTKHKSILPKFTHLKNFIIKYHKVIIIIFILALPVALYGYNRTEIYYNLDSKLPKSLESVKANTDLKEKFGLVSLEMLLVENDIPDEEINLMLDEIKEVDGIEWAFGISNISDLGIPEMIIPEDILSKVKNDEYNLVIISSKYEMATDEFNSQVKSVNSIIKKYDEGAILAGEGPLMNDLVEIADHDFNSVNTISIGIIFVIMLIILKSISLPFILMIVIEFAIFINMGIPYYQGTVLPFIASIVIGTIQLGATIDYAILITSKYTNKRKEGIEKKDAIDYALGSSIVSIFVSGLCFFGATIGVGVYSEIEIISSLCVLMSRGAIISMVSVAFILPSLLMVFDKLVCKTTIGMRKVEYKNFR
ncbi:MAG: MMPL family transporter [Clostridia bacterium]|nr:MMPL family transporter [Clostridia bacterium]